MGELHDLPSAPRSLSALSDGDLALLGEALRLRCGLEPEQLPGLQAANQAYLDAAVAVVAPSQPTATAFVLLQVVLGTSLRVVQRAPCLVDGKGRHRDEKQHDRPPPW